MELKKLVTEQINQKTVDLDITSIRDALLIMNEEDAYVAQAIRKVIPEIEKTVK